MQENLVLQNISRFTIVGIGLATGLYHFKTKAHIHNITCRLTGCWILLWINLSMILLKQYIRL